MFINDFAKAILDIYRNTIEKGEEYTTFNEMGKRLELNEDEKKSIINRMTSLGTVAVADIYSGYTSDKDLYKEGDREDISDVSFKLTDEGWTVVGNAPIKLTYIGKTYADELINLIQKPCFNPIEE